MEYFPQFIFLALIISLRECRGEGETSCHGGFLDSDKAINIGQKWDHTGPARIVHVDLVKVISSSSSFELRTFDPEGVLMFGDTRGGRDWFLLALRGGRPEIHIHNQMAKLSVTGGPRLNDGEWHKVQVRSEGHHIVLEVDSQESLRIGHVTETLSDGLDTLMRFAVGGILTNHTQLMEPLQTPLDGCLRGWTWLGQSPAWLPDSAPLTPPKLCFSSHRRGSYFPGAGKAVFRTQDFLPGAVSQDGQWSLSVQMQLQSVTDSFPLLTVSHPESGLLLSLRGSHKTIVLDVGRSTTLTVAVPELGGCGASLLLLEMTSKKVTLRVGHDLSKLPVSEEEYIAVRDAWQGGAELHLGGDLGVSPQYFHGCLQNILLQGKTVDLDSALSKSDRIWSHSCPQPAGETA